MNFKDADRKDVMAWCERQINDFKQAADEAKSLRKDKQVLLTMLRAREASIGRLTNERNKLRALLKRALASLKAELRPEIDGFDAKLIQDCENALPKK